MLGLLIIWATLAGCTQKISVPDTEITAYPSPTITTTAIVSSLPTTTPSETPPQPEAVLPTLTPEPTATPVLFSLPGWITEPSANILLLGTIPTQTISFLNVDNRQRYDAPMQLGLYSPKWQWQEDGYWLLSQQPNRSINGIDIETGDIVRMSDTLRDVISPDGRYAARILTHADREELVTIIDRETGIENELVNPFLHLQSRDEIFVESVWAVYWSPDGAYLSVLYDKHYYSDNYDRNLAIYTPAGEIVRQYVGLDTSWGNPWSPVAPYRILFTDGWTPCILEVTEDKKECLETVKQWLISQDVSPFHYIWSPDGNRISFVYNNDDTSDISKTGMCYIELVTNNIVCPVSADDLWLDRQLFARIQFWSPDGRYLALFFDNLGFLDVIGPMRVAVIDLHEQNFWLLEGEYSWPFSNPWRPRF